ncbi:hypothetical protein J5X84_40595 [Streptosporangiaceae bacterium NEAU-GS5]|nr:hypothetical protein [Streptosporangiaceae bacterium NEAU-GS5]
MPTYVAAEAETTPLPKITVPPPTPPPTSSRGLGDLPMRLVYRTVVAALIVALIGGVASFVFFRSSTPTGTTAAPTQATAASPAVSPAANTAPPTSTASSSAQPAATPLPSASPGKTAMAAALADPRVQVLPEGAEKLAAFDGKAAKARGVIKDKRSGVSLPRFDKYWKLGKASPFGTRQNLAAHGVDGLLVTCPVPIEVQDDLRDTAFLAARWTLNHHPAGSTITWTASQPITVSKRDGWLLGFEVDYTLAGAKHKSMAAVALVDVPDTKPALVFVSIPDTQKKRWRDINTVMSQLKVL